jgi:hypothetical protein
VPALVTDRIEQRRRRRNHADYQNTRNKHDQKKN